MHLSFGGIGKSGLLSNTVILTVSGDGGDLMQHVRLITTKWLMHHVL